MPHSTQVRQQKIGVSNGNNIFRSTAQGRYEMEFMSAEPAHSHLPLFTSSGVGGVVMSKLAIIIPYVGEWPSILFTVRSIHDDLKDVDHEIIVVDNWCDEVVRQGRTPDRGHLHIGKKGEQVESHLLTISKQCSWLKYMMYDLALSHWQCKAHAVANTNADYLMFIDAHCIAKQGSLVGMYHTYRAMEDYINGTLHLPLTYNILEDKRLIYSLQWEPEKGFIGYTFCSAPQREEIMYEVPCMSSCGSLMSRKVYNSLQNAWAGLTSYSGGEHIMNYVLATLGYKHWIYNRGILHHHGDERGYSWNWGGYQYNRAVAMYLIAGEAFMWKYLDNVKCPDVSIKMSIGSSVLENYDSTFKNIELNRKQTIEDWKVKRREGI